MDIASLHRRESIILTTIDLIDEVGIQAVSTREVANRQGISQGTVFQYFKKKNELLNAVLEQFAMYDNDIYDTTKLKNMEPKEAIQFYIDSYLSYYENYPAITAVTQAYDVLRNDPELGSKVRSIFTRRAEAMLELIVKAQQSGVMDSELDSSVLADIFLSTFNGICLKWRVNTLEFSLRERTLEAIHLLLNKFSPNK